MNYCCFTELRCRLSNVPTDIEVHFGGESISFVNATFQPGQQISFVCVDSEALLRGQKTAQCTESGDWSNTFPIGCCKLKKGKIFIYGMLGL